MLHDPVSFVTQAVSRDRNVAGSFAGAIEELAGRRPEPSAMQRAYAAIKKSSRERDLKFVRERTREYLARPRELAMLDRVLPLCSPEEALERLRELGPARHYVEAVNRRAAKALFRFLRRKARAPEAFTREVTDAGVAELLQDPAGPVVGVCPFTGEALFDGGDAA